MATKLSSIFIITILAFSITEVISTAPSECDAESSQTSACNNKERALSLKIIAIVALLITSLIGVTLPLVTRSVPTLSPDREVFIIAKAFAAGIILATGFMHVLPDSFDMLSSDCLAEKPWHEFPFTGFVAMCSAIVTLMVDSMATSIYTTRNNQGGDKSGVMIIEDGAGENGGGRNNVGNNHPHFHHNHGSINMKEIEGSKLLRYRVISMVLEFGIIVHSVVIGLSLGASTNTCTIKGLVAALCFHQMFEGMGLGGSILQAEYNLVKKSLMAFFFAVTTPFGIVLGLALSNTYKESSPHALVTVGLLNASSAGLLIYMAMVNLLASDFMGPKLQGSVTLQIKAYVAVLLGAGGMSIMALWA